MLLSSNRNTRSLSQSPPTAASTPTRRASRRLRRILGGEDGYLRVSGGCRTVEHLGGCAASWVGKTAIFESVGGFARAAGGRFGRSQVQQTHDSDVPPRRDRGSAVRQT